MSSHKGSASAFPQEVRAEDTTEETKSSGISLGDLVRQYFPDADNQRIDDLLWNETGYPNFWRSGWWGNRVIDCLHIQLARAAARENFGEFGYFDGPTSMDLAWTEWRNREAREEEQRRAEASLYYWEG